MDQADAKIALRVEHFHDDEALEFRINSSVEILYILRNIAHQSEPVALFYDDAQELVVTRVLEIDEDEEGIWLDAGESPGQNRQLLHSDEVIFVSMHQHIKIQFTVSDIGLYPYKGGEAFFVDMPSHILRVLRREFVRIPIPPDTPVTCIIPTKPKSSDLPIFMHEVPVAEISGDGLGLVCEESEDTLLPGKVFRNCQILIPDFDVIKATLRVRTNHTFTTPDGTTHKRVGCQLIFLDNRMSFLLQRFVIYLQGIHEKLPPLSNPKTEESESEPEPGDG